METKEADKEVTEKETQKLEAVAKDSTTASKTKKQDIVGQIETAFIKTTSEKHPQMTIKDASFQCKKEGVENR